MDPAAAPVDRTLYRVRLHFNRLREPKRSREAWTVNLLRAGERSESVRYARKVVSRVELETVYLGPSDCDKERPRAWLQGLAYVTHDTRTGVVILWRTHEEATLAAPTKRRPGRSPGPA